MKEYSICFLCLIALCVSGCEEFLAVNAPKDQLISESVFSNDGHANAALTGIYSQMYTSDYNPYSLPFRTGLASDELVNYSTNGGAVLLYQNNLHASDALTNAFWDNGYNFIYQANAIWEGCNQSTSLSPALKQQLMAEAAFIRAFWYFYLVNFYGDIPVLVATDYQDNSLAKRKPVGEVYQQIISDLLYAVDNLNQGYVDRTGVNICHERIRPNKSAAKALLARVFLYNKEWKKAVELATDVISNHALYDTVSLDQVFKMNSPAAIWQLPRTSGGNLGTIEAQRFVLTARPLSNALNNCSTLSSNLLQAFEAGDERKLKWVGHFTDTSVTPSITYPFPFKYKEFDTTNPTEYSTVLRLAEQYLIRAEARIMLGFTAGALEDLNIIRRRAGLAPISVSEKNVLLDTILHERQVELFAEWGHRWLDLKRNGEVDGVMSIITPKKGGTWNSTKQWWPIPQRELNSNPNLKQNNGYDL